MSNASFSITQLLSDEDLFDDDELISDEGESDDTDRQNWRFDTYLILRMNSHKGFLHFR